MKIKIFLFHRVSPQRDKMWDPMDPYLFDQIIRFLHKHYACIKLEDYFRDPQSFQDIKRKLCAVVFDDGYRDFLEFALPILQCYQMPSSMYIVSGCVQSQLPPWTYQLDNCLYHSRRLKMDIDTSFLPEQLKKTQWESVQQRVEFGKALKISLKKMSNERRIAVFNQVLQELDDAEQPSGLMLNWDEIRYIISEGVEVGSHTHSHPLLASMYDEAAIKHELQQSYDLIRENCKITPYTISYPIGSYDQRVMSISRELGYQLGLAVDQKFYDEQRDDQFAVPRTELYNEGFVKTRLRISGVYQKIKDILT